MTEPTRNEGSGSYRVALPDPNKALAEQEPDVLLAMSLFGEARGESDVARRGVAQVVLNRAKAPRRVFGSRPGADFEENLRRVLLKPRQFSCFLPDDPNYPKLLRPLDYEAPEVWERCLRCAQEALASKDQEDSLTANSDHYFDDSLLSKAPPWADPAKQTVVIGRLRFYRLYLSPPRRGGAGSLVAGSQPSLPTRPAPGAARRARPTGGLDQQVPGSGSCSRSFPAPHPPSQRSPRLGSNRWIQRSRELSSLGSGIRESAIGNRGPRIPNPESRIPKGARLCLAPVLLCLVLTGCNDLERTAYRTLATTRVEYETARRQVVEAVLHGFLSEEQWERFMVSGHSFLEAHNAAVEAFVGWSQTQSQGDRARLETSLEILPRLVQELHALVNSFEEAKQSRDSHGATTKTAPITKRCSILDIAPSDKLRGRSMTVAARILTSTETP